MKKKRTKYPLHEDFKKWENMNPPINGIMLPIMQFLMGKLYKQQKSDDYCNVRKIKIPYKRKKTIKAIIYEPVWLQLNAPCLVYFHGGGFVLPAAPYHYSYARQYALGANCKVVLVDYPLAPKHRHPIAPEACFAAYKWAVNNAEELEIDPSRIAVGGDSAGGNISAVVSLMASDNAYKLPVAQMLIYPAVGSRKETASMKMFTDTPMCNSVDYKRYCKLYFKDNKQMTTSRYASPLNAESLKIYPESYVETAEFDCLRDEAKLFAKMLKSADVPVTIYETKATMHGYDIVEDSLISKESVKKRIEFLNNVFNKKISSKITK